MTAWLGNLIIHINRTGLLTRICYKSIHSLSAIFFFTICIRRNLTRIDLCHLLPEYVFIEYYATYLLLVEIKINNISPMYTIEWKMLLTKYFARINHNCSIQIIIQALKSLSFIFAQISGLSITDCIFIRFNKVHDLSK